MGQQFEGIEKFVARMHLDHCQSSIMTIKKGSSNWKGEETNMNLAQRVFAVTSSFIGVMDVLQMGLLDVDNIAPALRDAYKNLCDYPNLPARYTHKAVIERHVMNMDSKKASDQITEEESRQLKFDLERALSDFKEIVLASS